MDPQEVIAFVDNQAAQIASRPQDLAFEPQEYADRLRRLQSAMEEAQIDTMIVSAPDAMCWLHGYQARWYKSHSTTAWPPFHCTAVHLGDERLLHFDMERHRLLIPRTSVATDLRLSSAATPQEWLDFFLGELQAAGWLAGSIGIEKWSSVPNRATSEMIEAALENRGCAVVDGTLVTRRPRRLKSPAEIAVVRRAAEVCDAGLRALQGVLAPGVTELEGWAAMMSAMIAAGGEPAALQENVWAGTSPLIHALSSRRQFEAGDIVCTDPCGVVHRYHANAARTLSIGEPEPAALELMDVLAQGAGPIRGVRRSRCEPSGRSGGPFGPSTRIPGYGSVAAGSGATSSEPRCRPTGSAKWMFPSTTWTPTTSSSRAWSRTTRASRVSSLIDTFIIGASGAERLSSVPREILLAAS